MTDLIVELIARAGYLGIFVLMALENVVPPIPSELVLGLAGIAVARGQMSFAGVLVVATLGSTMGNYMWYALGRRFGYLRLRPFVERHGRWLTLDWHEVERLQRFFLRHGEWLVFAFRFMPVFRTMISLPAGIAGMPRWRFLLWTAGGTTIWNVILLGASQWLVERFAALQRYAGPTTIAIIVVLLAWYAWRVARWTPRD